MLKKIALFFFIVGTAYGQKLTYNVSLHETSTHKVGIGIDLKEFGQKIVTYQMPIWAPGAYSVTHYGHYVSDFKATDTKGRPLRVKQVNGDRWEILNANNIAHISYAVSDSHKDSTSLYFALAHIDTNFFFANGTCLFGYVNDKKDIPSKVTYSFPIFWPLATALDSVAGHDYLNFEFKTRTFKAKNYDELVDAPVMAGGRRVYNFSTSSFYDSSFQTRRFKDGKATYDIVLASDQPFPMDSLEDNIHKIVHAQTEFFHDTPIEHYTFLINAPTQSHMISEGLGALEHSNSSAYLLVNVPWNIFNQFGTAILSHEFFHLWNVKRIHSSLLGPFDYTKPVKTTSLWLSEGITDYYAHTMLTRAGIEPYKTFETMLGQLTGIMKRSTAAKTKSLEELSIAESEFDINNAMVFYFKGTLVGLMLDIEIRSRTNNKKTLDDVMLALNAEAKKGKTFNDNELIGKVEKIVGLDLQDFYKKYIAGKDDLPIDEYLKKMGVGRDTILVLDTHPDAVLKSLSPGPSRFEVVYGFGKGEGYNLLTNTNDILKSGVKHLPLTSEILNTKKVFRDYAPLRNATPLEIEIRHGIVGKDY